MAAAFKLFVWNVHELLTDFISNYLSWFQIEVLKVYFFHEVYHHVLDIWRYFVFLVEVVINQKWRFRVDIVIWFEFSEHAL